jgi:aromatic-amino-acid transaminase
VPSAASRPAVDFKIDPFSKSFSLYGERVGALSVVCESKDEAARVLSQLKIVIRTNYSNPPTHGAQVVATVLTTPALRAQWEQELAGMRNRIKSMRGALVERLKAAGVKQDLGFITTQRGMFSYSGLTKPQMERLRSEFGVYGRLWPHLVAALNEKNSATRREHREGALTRRTAEAEAGPQGPFRAGVYKPPVY